MDPGKTLVATIMEKEVAVLSPEERLDLAEDMMRLGQVRHLPVVEESGRLVGVVSSHDLLASSLTKVLEFDPAHRRTFLRGIEVSEVMTRDPVFVAPDASLRHAAELMLRHRIGCIPVVEPDQMLVGLVTETDALRALLQRDDEARSREEEEDDMSEQARFSEELEELRRVRDELRVKVHLGKAEAKDLWDKTEHKLEEFERKVQSISNQAEEPLHDIGEAAKLLVNEIRDGYRRIRAAL